MQTSRVIGVPGWGSLMDQRERAAFFGSFATAALRLIGRDNEVRSKKVQGADIRRARCECRFGLIANEPAIPSRVRLAARHFV